MSGISERQLFAGYGVDVDELERPAAPWARRDAIDHAQRRPVLVVPDHRPIDAEADRALEEVG